jgi:multiple antibiotic resistance protein
MPDTPEAPYLISLSGVFTLLFVMLGPFKILGPFAQLTRDADDATRKQIAVRAFGIAAAAVLVGGFAGRAIAAKWHVSPVALLLAGGIIFAIVGLRLVLAQYEPAQPAPPKLPATPMAAAMRITFPTVLTPYGVAALIILLANSQDASRTTAILAILLGILVLDLLAMLFARQIMGGGVLVIVLQILGVVLGVLQFALAIEIILFALRALRVIRG